MTRLGAAYGRDLSAALPAAAPDVLLAALRLAEAALRYCDRGAAASGRPPQIAVLGPTQTGKSTIVNLLLGQSVAAVSPLAGFTVHPQGFATRPFSSDAAWIAGLFPGWPRREPTELRRDELRAYTLTTVDGGTVEEGDGPGLPACVLWDTPDFDSLAARQYAAGVLEVAALADLHLVVLSKEKYSDLSVWQLLDLTAPLGRPLVLCVNKLTADAEEAVVRSLRQRLAERGGGRGDVPIVTLPYEGALAAGDLTGSRPQVTALWAALAERSESLHRRGRAVGARALLRRHWDDWVEPVRAEHRALAEWQAAVQSSATRFMEAYTRDYLEHPRRYDAFRRATVELLNLLELPKVGGVVARARQVVTWPARRLMAAGRSWWDHRRAPASRLHSLGVEAGVLVGTIETLLTSLQRDVARRCRPSMAGVAVWQAMERTIEAERPRLQARFEAGIQAHHQHVDAEVRAAARRLYDELRQHPSRLTALRTARATIDLGYVLLAVKTGGLSALDTVWAPAAFAVSSLLMEGVAGLELGREQRRLKARQRAAVEESFVRDVWVRELAALAGQLDAAGRLGIEPDELDAAAAALRAWEVGDE